MFAYGKTKGGTRNYHITKKCFLFLFGRTLRVHGQSLRLLGGVWVDSSLFNFLFIYFIVFYFIPVFMYTRGLALIGLTVRGYWGWNREKSPRVRNPYWSPSLFGCLDLFAPILRRPSVILFIFVECTTLTVWWWKQRMTTWARVNDQEALANQRAPFQAVKIKMAVHQFKFGLLVQPKFSL